MRPITRTRRCRNKREACAMEYELSRNMRGMKPSIIREILKQMSDPSLLSLIHI